MELGIIAKLIPAELKPFLQVCGSHGFTVVLVGGAVRDVILGNKQIADWDFELHHNKASHKDWQNLLAELGGHYQLNNQLFGVVKAKTSQGEFQFAPPRKETYSEHGPWGHSDFSAQFDFSLSFKAASQRRDFTMNALGAAFINDQWQLWDEWQGSRDLANKQLVAVDTTTFIKDPVRYLRAKRFALSLGFQETVQLRASLMLMDLSKVSAFYIRKEAEKARYVGTFLQQLADNATLPKRFSLLSNDHKQVDQRYQQQVTAHDGWMSCAAHGDLSWEILVELGICSPTDSKFWQNVLQVLSGKPSWAKGPMEFSQILLQESFQHYVRFFRQGASWTHAQWFIDWCSEYGLIALTNLSETRVNTSEINPEERMSFKVWSWLQSKF